MSGIAKVAALIAALAHIGTAPLEMFLFTRPSARRFLHVEVENVADVQMWAFVVGARNLLAGIGVLVGLTLLQVGDEQVGRVVVLTAAAYMLLASLAMGIADSYSGCGDPAAGAYSEPSPPVRPRSSSCSRQREGVVSGVVKPGELSGSPLPSKGSGGSEQDRLAASRRGLF